MTHEEHQEHVRKTSPEIRAACRRAANQAAAQGRTPQERRLFYKRAHARNYAWLRAIADEQWRENTRAASKRYQQKLKDNPSAIRRRTPAGLVVAPVEAVAAAAVTTPVPRHNLVAQAWAWITRR